MEPERNESQRRNIYQEMTDLYYAMDSNYRPTPSEERLRKDIERYQHLMRMPDVIRGDYSTDTPEPVSANSTPSPTKTECHQKTQSQAICQGFRTHDPSEARLERTVMDMGRKLRLVERKVISLERILERRMRGRIDFSRTVAFLGVTCIGIFVTKAFL